MTQNLNLIKDTRILKQLAKLGDFVGNTPLFPIQNVFKKKGVKIFAKLEWQQLGSSVKARPAYRIIKEAVLSGALHEGKRLLDASSGNTAIAYATFAAALNIPVTITLPENASQERKNILRALGAELILTSKFDSTDGAQEKAASLYKERPDLYFYADQYGNDANWRAHYDTTGPEILSQSKGEITHFVAGVGTTGTFVGTSRALAELNPTIHFTALHPESALHGIEGWKHLGTAKIPNIYDPKIAHQNLEVSTEEAFELLGEVARKEGLLISPSAAANLAGAIKVANKIDRGVIVTIFPDNGEKYSEIYKNQL